MTQLFTIKSAPELDTLLSNGVFWRKPLGLIVLKGDIEKHPNRVRWQNELNTHYYACGCDESAFGFFIGVILGCLLLAGSWFQVAIPNLLTIIMAILLAVACGLIGKAIGKLIANKKLKLTIQAIQE